MYDIKLMAVDLAKNVFQVCALDKNHQVLFNKKLRRGELIKFFSNKMSCPIYMEACYSSHYWARRLNSMGFQSFLIPAQHVTPFVRGNKNDHNDALAIAECSFRPGLRFVPVKTEQQQEIISVHRIRQRLVKNRVQVTNQLRGLLTDFGIVFPKGVKGFKQAAAYLHEHEVLSEEFRLLIFSLEKEFRFISEQIDETEDYLNTFYQNNHNCQIVGSIPGFGYLTTSALVAMIDKGQAFKKASDIGVWIGLTPRQYSSGARSSLGRITKRGDRYLRKILVQGAAAAVRWAKRRSDRYSLWIKQLITRVGRKKAIVAIAHKMIRLAWILLQKQEMFRIQPSH